MTNRTVPSVRSYLDDLDRALSDLPRNRRQEIVRDIRAHIDAALADAPEQTPAVIATVLDHLGTPQEIAESARAELPVPQPRIATTRDVITIVLLLVGGIVVPVIGWVVGAVLLWTSAAWRTKDKLIATLLVPGGLLSPLLLGVVAARTSVAASCQTVSAPAVSASTGDSGTTVADCTTSSGSGVWSTILLIAVLIVTVGGPIFSSFWLGRHARRSA